MAVSGRYMFCFRCKFLVVVLLMFSHRKCSGQVSFDCSTLQPQPGNSFLLGSPEETIHYTVEVDQSYYQQSSTRRVTVSAGALEYTSLYLQARIVNGGPIEGWSSPYPFGYSVTGCQAGQLDTILKLGDEAVKSEVFEWVPPFADTSVDVMFMATFINGGKYYIITSEIISDPCNPSPCSHGQTCFRGAAPPGYFCADDCIALTCQNGGTCTVQNGEAECICLEGLTGRTCESCGADFCQNGGQCIINSEGHPQCLCATAYTGTRCQFSRDGSTTACNPNPCLNGGSCGVQTDGSYQCTCTNSYVGSRCENRNTFCSVIGCRNGGTCNPLGTTAGSCICAEGYQGTQCELVDICFNVCQNGGTCSTNGGSVATCQCPAGFQGPRCETPSDEFCSLDWCKNGATCVPFSAGVGGYCMCQSGFTGPYCDEPDNRFCAQSPCLNGGECLDLPMAMGAGQCKCPAEFTGALCEEPVSQGCFPDRCQNGGTCVSVSSTASQCQCVDGYTGSHCEEITGFCSYELCRNGATCISSETSETSGTCICAEGFTGFQCETQIISGFCALGLCQNGATCVGGTIGYCECAEGFTGPSCDEVVLPEFCAQGLCQNGATCIDTAIGGSCICADGFMGARCDQVETAGFCAQGLCQNDAICIDTPSGGSCICAEGFMGARCDQVDTAGFCAQGLCQNGATCIDTASGGSCVCAEGFTGAACDQVETPDFCAHGLCQNGATCVETDISGYCVCAEGFSGPACDQVNAPDPCSPNPCFNGGSCFPLANAPFSLCVCAPGYTGTLCETVETPCTSQPCQNEGTCTVTQGSPGYSCQCVSPFLGTNCDTVSPCATNPCQNGGQCTPVGQGFNCACSGVLSGQICDVENYCLSRQPCQNGGTCTFTGHATYQCQCLPDFTGSDCQLAIPDPCSPNPCLNLGTCTAISTTEFQCTCPSHVFGTICHLPNPCGSNPCLQGSPCQPAADGNSYSCVCPPGFTGINCQTPIVDVCSTSECVNGTCVEDAQASRNYRCECQEGFGGDFCDDVIDACLAYKPCMNGGICTNDGSSYECNCNSPFFGESCLYNRNNGPVFIDCSETTHHYEIGSGNTAYVNLNITAMVPETREVIGFDVIVGPDSVSFPGEVTYTEDYLEGQKFVLRATDEFARQSTCSFTIRLTDLVAPTVECPGDHQDISSKDKVAVSSLPLPPIEASDNIGLREENFLEYSPSEVRVDGQSRQVTVSVYDVAGNKGECQFGLTIHQGVECQSINTDNGRVNCSMNPSRNRACEITCDEGFRPPNGDLYTCTNVDWDKVPLPCLAVQEPDGFSKSITFVFAVSSSLCEQDEFLMNVSKAMKAKLTELNLCGQEGSASACGENSISASCASQPAQDVRRKRQTTDSEVEVEVEISGSSKDDITGLITTIRNGTKEGFSLVVGDQTLDLMSYDVTPQFIIACQSGSISRQEACLTCPRGTYHHPASNECRLCEAGSFQDETGQLQCKECAADTYQNQIGQTSCITCDAGAASDGVMCSSTQSPEGSWVTIVIYACVGVGALLVIIIFILMVCLWQSTQEEKRQDQKRWELGHTTQLNKSYEPEEDDLGFRPRVNTTVSATTYQTVPEGDGTPNLGNGVTNGGLVRIPTEELYAGLMMDSHGRTLSVGVDNHSAPQPRRHQYEQNGYYTSHHSPSNEFMSYGHDRHNFPV